MLRRLRDSEDGGSVVELALTSLLIVPMVFYAIYVGEAFVSGIKAQEAEISAGWEATAYLTHAYNGGPSAKARLAKAATSSAARVKASLSDFDSFVDGSTANGYVGVLGHSSLQEVVCAPASVTEFGPLVLGKDYLHPDGWVRCQAKVQFEQGDQLPTEVHQEFIGTKLVQDSFKQLVICGNGNTLKGCTPNERGFVVFADDWGLENSAPTRVEDWDDPGNPEYYNPGKSIYRFGTGPVEVVLNGATLWSMGAGDQGKTGKFKMGYAETVGTPRPFKDHSAKFGDMKLHLSPFHEKASAANNNEKDLSQRAYEVRKPDHYLSMEDPNWNG